MNNHKSNVSFRGRFSLLCAPAVLLLVGSFFPPGILTAGSGGTVGGCAFATTVHGQATYLACQGPNTPMWYVSSNPIYTQGDIPCGYYGNQNCGMEVGDPINE